jgi:hypothetical protein
LQHAFENPALHGIVVDDQNTPTQNCTSPRPQPCCAELGHFAAGGLMAT